jgi:hypothetical protein
MYTREKEGVRGQEERSIAALVVTLRSFYRYARSITALVLSPCVAGLVQSVQGAQGKGNDVLSLRLVYHPASRDSQNDLNDLNE